MFHDYIVTTLSHIQMGTLPFIITHLLVKHLIILLFQQWGKNVILNPMIQLNTV